MRGVGSGVIAGRVASFALSDLHSRACMARSAHPVAGRAACRVPGLAAGGGGASQSESVAEAGLDGPAGCRAVELSAFRRTATARSCDQSLDRAAGARES